MTEKWGIIIYKLPASSVGKIIIDNVYTVCIIEYETKGFG